MVGYQEAQITWIEVRKDIRKVVTSGWPWGRIGASRVAGSGE